MSVTDFMVFYIVLSYHGTAFYKNRIFFRHLIFLTYAVQNMSPSVYFSYGRPRIQLNWNDLSCVSSYFFLQSTVFVSSFIFRFLPGICDISETFWIFKLNF